MNTFSQKGILILQKHDVFQQIHNESKKEVKINKCILPCSDGSKSKIFELKQNCLYSLHHYG